MTNRAYGKQPKKYGGRLALYVSTILFLSTSCVTVDETVFLTPSRMTGYGDDYFMASTISIETVHVPSEGANFVECKWIHGQDFKKAIVFICGRGGNVTWYYPFLKLLSETAKADVFAVNPRGYGGSPGQPEIDGISRDIQTAAGYFMSNLASHDTKTYICGFSTGSFYALSAAGAVPDLSEIILLAPFSNARQEILDYIANTGIFGAILSPKISDTVDRINNEQLISRILIPILILHGKNDNLNSPLMSSTLYKLSKSPTKKLVLVDGAGHETLIMEKPYNGKVVSEISSFIESTSN